jgi:hypothetical protein
MGGAVDVFHQAGVANVVFVTAILPPPEAAGPEQRQRAERYNELVAELAADRADVKVIDFGHWTDTMTPDEFGRLFPDGVHASDATAAEVWTTFLGPELERAVDRLRVIR